ncbi:11626_t:CDS:2 [Scutellospora calospora]|uniref:11626_t:CDS:1 n=1 Tax=Scutellospora calospora TaxID=85575 RepID=A0ACA9KGD5_9GLOM|nr:11626_t:CDS:2 [Scutellospora calospora]
MVQSLPRECLEEVFHLLQNDKTSLHSCLLVNRFWCSSAAPFLWRRPFKLAKKPCPELIEIYTSLFDKRVKCELKVEGINIPISTTPKVFDYPSFLREFRFDDLYESTSSWLQDGYDKGKQIKRESEVFDDLRVIKILVNELCKLFFSKTKVIESLSLNTQRLVGLIDRRFWSHHPGDIQYTPTSFEDFRGAYGFDDLLKLPSYFGANLCLPFLQKFEYGGDATDGKIMKVLSMICKNLDTLEISFSSWQRKHADPMMMLSLLQAQNSLKRMVLRRGGSNCLPILIEGLRSQSNSLTYLEFNGADFRISVSLNSISYCINLEILIFDRCLGLSDDIVEPLSNSKFFKLKKFLFRKSIGFRDLRTILAPADIRLGKKVWNVRRPLGIVARGVGDFPPPMILSTISIYCPKLVIIETHISKETLPYLKLILDNCLNLEQIFISIGTELMDDEIFWKDLSFKLPKKLRNLMIVIEGTFWLMVLHWLLGNCKVPLEILQFPRSNCIDDEYLCLITQYAKRIGSLKRLALAKRTKVSSEGMRRALMVFESITKTGEWIENDDNLR